MPVLTRAAAMCVAAAALHATTLHAAPANGPQGVWLDHTGRGAVEIKPCGDKLCGHVVWVKSNADAKGCGRQIIGDAVSSGKVIHSGWIYSPERGKRYNVELSPMADGRLKVLGYAGTKLFSKTMYWTPAAADLQRCGTAQPPAAAPAQTAKAQPPAEQAAATPPKAQAPAQVAAPAPQKTTPPAEAGRTAVAPTTTPPQPPVAAPPPAPAAVAPSAGQPEADETDHQEVTTDASSDSSDDERPRRIARILDQVLTRSADGDCKLDLPWVKVEFRCEER